MENGPSTKNLVTNKMEEEINLTYSISSDEYQENGIIFELTVLVQGESDGSLFATLIAMTRDGAIIPKQDFRNPHKHPLWQLGEDIVARWADAGTLEAIAWESPAFAEYRAACHDEMRLEREWYRSRVI